MTDNMTALSDLNEFLLKNNFSLDENKGSGITSWSNDVLTVSRTMDRNAVQLMICTRGFPQDSFDVLGVVGYIQNNQMFNTNILELIPSFGDYISEFNRIFSQQNSNEREVMASWMKDANRAQLERLFGRKLSD